MTNTTFTRHMIKRTTYLDAENPGYPNTIREGFETIDEPMDIEVYADFTYAGRQMYAALYALCNWREISLDTILPGNVGWECTRPGTEGRLRVGVTSDTTVTVHSPDGPVSATLEYYAGTTRRGTFFGDVVAAIREGFETLAQQS